MKVYALLLCLWLVGMGTAQAETAAQGACGDKKPLYDPDHPPTSAAHADGLGYGNGLASLLDMAEYPITFASSGDACLGPIPVYLLSRHTQPARDTHAMARRLAPEMAAYSRRTGMEACARMCTTPQGVVANLVTLRAHVVCLAEASTCPPGSTPTRETIHSHPPQRAFMANPVDALGWDEPEIDGKLTLSGYPDSLSPNDRRQAPVWMVGTRGQLVWLASPEGTEVERP